jgi:ABC-type branched-subunit amino acid transport system permease subunit
VSATPPPDRTSRPGWRPQVTRVLSSGWLRPQTRSRKLVLYGVLALGLLLFPPAVQLLTGGGGDYLISEASDAGVYVLLALGLNVVVGYAGLLDLGYAAFFAIGSYTYAFLASDQLAYTPLHHALHLPFWLLLFVAVVVAAAFGVILGFPTLRLRGDYLAIVTLGFGEIVPRVFRNASIWTNGVNGIGALDVPSLPAWVTGPWAGVNFGIVNKFLLLDPLSYYVVIVVLIILSVWLIHNLYNSRFGRAWVAIREDEGAAAAMGLNPVAVKLKAFAIGASLAGFAGCYYAAKLSLVDPNSFSFVISVTVLIMVALGGMGSIPGVIIGALVMCYFNFNFLPNLPQTLVNIANSIGLSSLDNPHGGWPGLLSEGQNVEYMLFGVILLVIMLIRPEGLIPSAIRRQELAGDRSLRSKRRRRDLSGDRGQAQ